MDKIGLQSAQNIYQKYTQIYPRRIQDIQDNTKCQAAAGPSPAQARGRAQGVPGPRGPGLGPGLSRAGPAAAWYFVFFLDNL